MMSDLPPTPVPPKFAIDYIKSNLFRVSHVDGIIGAVTPAGKLHVICFAERAAVPRRQIFEADGNGRAVKPIHEETISRGSIVREMDVDLIMDLPVAESVLKWLSKQVEDMRAGNVQPLTTSMEEEE